MGAPSAHPNLYRLASRCVRRGARTTVRVAAALLGVPVGVLVADLEGHATGFALRTHQMVISLDKWKGGDGIVATTREPGLHSRPGASDRRMKMARDVISTCPVCSGELLVTRLECRACGTAIEGEFSVGRFGRLSREQMALLESFLRSRGNLKELERELKVSYPTVRARIDALVRALGLADGPYVAEDCVRRTRLRPAAGGATYWSGWPGTRSRRTRLRPSSAPERSSRWARWSAARRLTHRLGANGRLSVKTVTGTLRSPGHRGRRSPGQRRVPHSGFRSGFGRAGAGRRPGAGRPRRRQPGDRDA